MTEEPLTPEQVYSMGYHALQRGIHQKREAIAERKAALLKELDGAMAEYRADLERLNKAFERAKEQERFAAEERVKVAEAARIAAELEAKEAETVQSERAPDA